MSCVDGNSGNGRRSENKSGATPLATDPNDILLGKGDEPVFLRARYGNRHGLTAGATGTGKTVSLLLIAEGFSRIGVPVVMADVKGDVAGLAMPGVANEKIRDRAVRVGLTDYRPEASPVVFWDVYGTAGHPLRATVSEVGPTLMARMLELNDTQTGVLEISFKLADDRGLLLLDLDDRRGVAHLRRREPQRRFNAVRARQSLIHCRSAALVVDART